MRLSTISLVCLGLCAVLLAPVVLAQSDMVGTWTGDWGPAPNHRNPVTLVMSMEGGSLKGIINPGAENIELTKVTVGNDGMIEMEAVAPGRRGAEYSYTIEGKLEGGVFTGTWNHDNQSGDLKVTKEF